MKKKVLSILLSALIFLLCSCGGETNDTEGGASQGTTSSQAAVSQEAVNQEAVGQGGTADTLKDAFAEDFKVGACVSVSTLTDEDSLAFVQKEFSSITMENEMKPENLLDQKGCEESRDGMPSIDTDKLEKVLSAAKASGIPLRGHCLVWHNQTPDWFFCQDYEASNPQVDKATMRKRMEAYIKKVLTYCKENYPGLVYAWDVVNEACDDNGGYRTESGWYETYGDESYIMDAFTFARKYAEDSAKLFLNDYNEYMLSKRATIEALLKKLSEKGLVDGMGCQSHWTMDFPDASMIADALEAYAAIPGLEVQFTEIDMHNTDDSAEGLQRQADRYKEFFDVIVKADREGTANVTSVTFWGLNDEDTWLSGQYGEESYPLLFDDGERKPCYDSIKEVSGR